jgi:hypothetical protein
MHNLRQEQFQVTVGKSNLADFPKLTIQNAGPQNIVHTFFHAK